MGCHSSSLPDCAVCTIPQCWSETGDCFNIKMPSYQYSNSDYKIRQSHGHLSIKTLSYQYSNLSYNDKSHDHLIIIMETSIPGKIVFILKQAPDIYNGISYTWKDALAVEYVDWQPLLELPSWYPVMYSSQVSATRLKIFPHISYSGLTSR